MDSSRDKTAPRGMRGADMKRVADTGEKPVVVPIVVVAVDVHVTLVVVPAIEGGLCEVPSVPPPLEYSRG